MSIYKASDFEAGMKVRCIREDDGNSAILGWIGKIIFTFDKIITVEFDNPFRDGHDGMGTGRDGYCWNFQPENIEPVFDEPIFELNLSFSELMEA